MKKKYFKVGKPTENGNYMFACLVDGDKKFFSVHELRDGKFYPEMREDLFEYKGWYKVPDWDSLEAIDPKEYEEIKATTWFCAVAEF